MFWSQPKPCAKSIGCLPLPEIRTWLRSMTFTQTARGRSKDAAMFPEAREMRKGIRRCQSSNVKRIDRPAEQADGGRRRRTVRRRLGLFRDAQQLLAAVFSL